MRQTREDSRASCGNIVLPCLYLVYKNFDSKLLSNPSCEISIKSVFQKDGSLKSEIVRAKNNSPADDFYCQQAVAEYMIPGWDGVAVLFDFNSKMKTEPETASLEEAPESCVALHLIPHTFPGSTSTFPPGALTGKENTLFLKKSKLQDPALNNFRSDWSTFMTIHRPLIHDDIVAQAATLRKKYSQLFE